MTRQELADQLSVLADAFDERGDTLEAWVLRAMTYGRVMSATSVDNTHGMGELTATIVRPTGPVTEGSWHASARGNGD